ncbi:CHAD domain-containing protein [Mycobacterium sp. HUMS_1102779]|uniref:CHAD domain-containing protein n=1 Tax=Mycobacterium sp. HUMS_1102779 TaxID=3383487 RepID=UPI00389A996D
MSATEAPAAASPATAAPADYLNQQIDRILVGDIAHHCWAAEMPLDGTVAAGALRKKAVPARRKADRRLAEALESEDDAMLHRARKAAKGARYAAELCRPLGKPKRARRTIKHYKRIQNLLGEHQDTTVAEQVLRRMGSAAGDVSGENGFTFGMLCAREGQIAHECRRRARRLRR